MKLTRAVTAYLDHCRLNRRSPATIVTYENALGFLTRLALLKGRDEVSVCTPALIKEYFAVAGQERENTTETLMKKHSALSGFTKWGMGQRLWLADPMLEAPSYRKPERLPRPFARHEREGIMALPLDAEATALRAVLYYAGLRAGEIVRLQVRDVLFGDGIRPGRLRVLGKGNRERMVTMMPELEAALGDYLLDRTDPRQFVFHRRGRPWTVPMVRYRSKAWGRSIGIDRAVAHRFRHSAATEMFEAGADPRAAQRFLGHKHLNTTMIYTQVTDAEVERAVLQRSQMLQRRANIPRESSTDAETTR